MHQKSNRLANETSPYLLQHAENPVNWYPWGDEAIQRARREDKPILISIGYAACHWCHVMEQESFKDPGTADLMNERFVCIKVDREERPDLDQIYMTFVQMTTGSGGWPLNVFLTPDLEPFFGGTYFPPVERYGRLSWQTILKNVSHFYHQEKKALIQNLENIREGFQQVMKETTGSRIPDQKSITGLAEQLAAYYDPVNGGLGRAPKFPAAQALTFFLHYFQQSGDKKYLDMVEHSLKKMAEGGIYDHVGGGFARYSVDAQWLVPHFEKMLYDNAQLVPLYLDTYLLTNDAFYLTVVTETLEFVNRKLWAPGGGFYASLDADSEGKEGKYYIWHKSEVMELLGPENGAIFCHFFGVTDSGNFEGHTILHRTNHTKRDAARFNKSDEGINTILLQSKKRLLAAREKRIPPGLDAKILTAWNGLMLSAFARAYQVMQKKKYREIICETISFLKDRLVEKDHLLRSYHKGQAKHRGFLDDYAYLIQGLLDAYEALFEAHYLDWAYKLLTYVNHNFWDGINHGYYYTEYRQTNLLYRMKGDADQSLPSAAAVMLLNNLRFYSLTAENELIRKAEEILQKYSDKLLNNAYGYASYLQGLDFYLQKPMEILLVEGAKSSDAFLKAIFNVYLPNKIVILQRQHTAPQCLSSELLSGKKAINGKSTAYICRNFTCSLPITSLAELKKRLND